MIKVRAIEPCFVTNPTIPYGKRRPGEYREEDGVFHGQDDVDRRVVFEWHGDMPPPSYLVPAEMSDADVADYVRKREDAEARDTEARARAARRKALEMAPLDDVKPGELRLPGGLAANPEDMMPPEAEQLAAKRKTKKPKPYVAPTTTQTKAKKVRPQDVVLF